MDDKIVKLMQPGADLTVIKSLREIAREIEAGEFGFPVTSCVVIIGHTEKSNDANSEDTIDRHYCEVFRSGPRTDSFTTLGMMEEAKHSIFKMTTDE